MNAAFDTVDGLWKMLAVASVVFVAYPILSLGCAYTANRDYSQEFCAEWDGKAFVRKYFKEKIKMVLCLIPDE